MVFYSAISNIRNSFGILESGTIISKVNSIPESALPATFTITSSYTPSDVPRSGAYEYNVIVTGSDIRRTVNLRLYAAGQLMTFERDVYNGAWFSDWRGGYVTGTITSDFSHQSNPYLYKINNVVTFFVYIDVGTTITNNTPLAYFSVGFRPSIPIQVMGMFLGGSEDGCNAFFQVNPNGCLYQNYALSINAQKIAVVGTYSVE